MQINRQATRKDPDPLTLKTFIARWRDEISRKSDLWEGTWAVNELRGAKTLNLVRCERNHWLFPDLLNRSILEMKDYRDETSALAAGGLLTNQQFEDADDLFQLIWNKIEKRKKSIRVPVVRRVLNELQERAQSSRDYIAREKQEYKKTRHSKLGAWERLWSEHPTWKPVDQKIKLDKRLQLQLAKNFLRTLRLQNDHTLRTIARLIVLMYWVGDLAAEDTKSSVLRLRSTNRVLTPRNVQDTLRAKGLHKKRFPEPKS
jgi:hypothetical protein